MSVNLKALSCSFAALSVLGCVDAPPTASRPVTDAGLEDPPPPPGLVMQGSDLIQWDTVTPEFTRRIEGTAATLAGVLTSTGGKRRVELREVGSVRVLADSGWNLPAAGVVAPTGERVVCWNVMLGPERSGGRPPHPTRGVGVRCVTVGARGISSPTDASERAMTATWMQDLTVRDGRVELRYLRDRSGWLVTLDLTEGGTWARTLTVTAAGLSLGEGSLVEPLGARPVDP